MLAHRIIGSLEARPAQRRTIASVGLVAIVFILMGWSSMTGLGDSAGYDSGAFKEYAATLGQTGRLPTPAENYEYSLPPGYPLLGAYLDRLVGRVSFDAGRPLVVAPSPVRRGIWVALCLIGFLTLTLVDRRRSRPWFVGLGAAVLATAWGGTYLMTYVHEQPWSAKALPNLALTTLLVIVAGLFAREARPDRVYAPALAATAMALLPAVLRMGIVFHPDPLFALLGSAAILLTLRARRAGWEVHRGIAVGVTLGLAALVR